MPNSSGSSRREVDEWSFRWLAALIFAVLHRLGRTADELYAASALRTLGTGLETTNRNDGRRLLDLTARTQASNSLNAFHFIVAILPLW
jgi:hypothetical protein